MKEDPALEAVRDARKRISASVGNDVRKLVQYYERLQERHRERLVSVTGQSVSQDRRARDERVRGVERVDRSEQQRTA